MTTNRQPMTLTKEQQDQLLESAKPLIKWMNENCDPHCTAYVDQIGVELTSSVVSLKTVEFLRG